MEDFNAGINSPPLAEEKDPKLEKQDHKSPSNLHAEGLSKNYGAKKAVIDVSFSMEQGQVVGLLGPNGAGKTTTFYMIAGFIPVTGGKVWFNGKDITKVPMFLRARMGINYLPQEPSVFRKLTVAQNIMAVLEIRKDLNRHDRKNMLEQMLEDLSISHLAKQRAETLSGGERRRTEVGRALATNPRFLLLDEPFSGIDPIAVRDLRNVITHLSERNIGILITDHNVRDTLSITHHAYIINHGEILTVGTPEELMLDDRAREFYLGHDFTL